MIVHTFVDRSAMARAIKDAGADVVESEMDNIGQHMVDECEDIVAAKYTARGRRGGVQLHGSFYYRVEDNGDFPFTVSLLSRAEPAKLNSLEYGSRPHTIVPRDVGNPRARLQWPDEGWGTGIAKSVEHPGTGAGRFMHLAMDRTVRWALGRFR